ncbi:MAG: autotransporter domain-containing protein [Pseudomonas sp.]|nr:autotransporter domain-containing protein [Pseudomonas sp.]
MFAKTVLVVGMTMAGMANATPISTTWTGAVDSDWGKADNWDSGLPAPSGGAYINDDYLAVNQPTLSTTTQSLTGTVVDDSGTLIIASVGILNSTTVFISNSGMVNNAGLINGKVEITNNSKLITSGDITGSIFVGDNSRLELSGNAKVGHLSSGGAVQLGSNTLTVDPPSLTGGTFSGVISGTGGLIKSGGGTQVLTGANTYTGTTTLEAGGLTLSGGSAIANTGAVVVNGGVLALTHSETIGALSGIGGTVELGSNSLTMQANSGSTAYAGVISGTGDISKTGASTLALSGINTYSGATLVNGGLLTVNGSIANSAVTISSSGRLGGTGTVGSTTINGGVFAPGNSIGTQTVNGNLTLSGTSTYEVETDPAGAGSDLIQVNGVANLGGQVRHVGESGTYLPFSTYTILSATGGFAGSSFAGVTSDFAFLTPSLTYDLNNVYLGLQRNDTAVVDLAQSRNQLATAGALDSLPAGSALQNAFLGLTTNAVPGALNALSGELYASAAGAVLQNSQAFSNNLLQRSGRLLDESQRSALPLWIETQGATRRNDGDSNSAETIQRGGSVSLGGELAMPNDWILGGAFRYGDHRLSVDDRNSDADIDSYSIGLYGRWAQPFAGGSVRMTLGGVYGLHNIDAERDIYTSGLRQSLRSNYDVTSHQVFAELGYVMDMGADLKLEPYANLSWTQTNSDSFTEKGGSAALQAQSQSSEKTTSTLGLRSQLSLNNDQVQLDAGLGWQHHYGEVIPDTDLSFAGSSIYTVESAALGRDTALLDLGASYRIAPAITLRAGYSGQFGDNTSSNGANLTLKWDF